MTGRFVFHDEAGNTVGIRHARVEMANDDAIGVPSLMGTAETDADGNFSVTGTGGDWLWDGPDPFVRVVADSDAAKVHWNTFAYCYASATTWDPPNGSTIDVGVVSPSEGATCRTGLLEPVVNDHRPWQLYNTVRQAWELFSGLAAPELFPGTLATSGQAVPKLQAFWPAYDGDSATMIAYAAPDFMGVGRDAARDAAGVTTLYGGYHLLHHFAEYGADNRWNKGVGGAFSEFSTTFWQQRTYSTSYGCNAQFTGVTGLCGTVEAPPHYHPDTPDARLAWITSAILWDLHDATPGENHDGNDSADRLRDWLPVVWAVIVGFDPDLADPDHNHPRSLEELWTGFAVTQPDLANRLSGIYHENHGPNMPAADLRVTALSNPPTAVMPGGSFSATDTTTNSGPITTGQPSTTGFFLSLDATISPTGDIAIGQRTVGSLGSLLGESGPAALSVPLQTPPGTYYLGACADSPHFIFESDEANNCAASATQVVVQNSSVLSVAKAGNGSGTVTSTPAGISCGADCVEQYAAGTVVTLTATPAAGSAFAGWSGACGGAGACTVTVNAATAVTATFNVVPSATLSVSPTSVRVGRTVTLTWSNIPAPTPRDWIGVYSPSMSDTSFVWDRVYVTPLRSDGTTQSCSVTPGAAGVASASCRYTVPTDLDSGVYEFRLFSNDGYTRLAVSNRLTVINLTSGM